MAAGYPLPLGEDVQTLLADLLGRAVDVDDGRDFVGPDGAGAAVIADYVTDEGRVAALVVLDPGLAARSGAALLMVPAAVADESVAAGELAPTLLENVHEIVNIMARLLNGERSPHVRLRTLRALPGDLPHDAAALLAAPEARRAFDVVIEGYGPGRLELLVA
jgi:hypothetical protein